MSPLRISEELPPILRRRIFTGQIMCHSSGSRRPNQSPQVSGSEEGSYSFRISPNMLPHRGRNSASRHPKGHSALRVTIYHIGPHQKDNPRVPVSRLFKIYVINHQNQESFPSGEPESDILALTISSYLASRTPQGIIMEGVCELLLQSPTRPTTSLLGSS